MEVKKKKKNWAGRRDEINGEEKKREDKNLVAAHSLFMWKSRF